MKKSFGVIFQRGDSNPGPHKSQKFELEVKDVKI